MSPRAEPPRLGLLADGEERPHPLPAAGRLVIGSDARAAELVLAGAGVAPAHCEVGRLRAGGWAVRDLGSPAGTLCNGEPVGSRRLAPGDELALGARRLAVVSLAEPAGAAEGSAPARVPARLGGYRIERPLGRGRTGLVVLAVQESLRRRVALKLLDPRLAADRDFVQRFESEAHAAAALNHPNVVTVHDSGEVEGQRFLAMEFMSGGSLEDELAREGRLAWPRVLDVLHDAGAALAYAESRGIVHRDVKPSNLMRGEGGMVKLADLGLATAASVPDQDGRVFGTPHFVSPEQARGGAVDHRSDLYSLGATAYRLLTGTTPFEGRTAREILRAQLALDPEPPRARAPGLPPEVDALVLRLLAKDPEGRPASAAALLEEVDRLRAAAAAARWAEAAPARGGRHWALVLAAGVLGALGLFVLLVLAARRLARRSDQRAAEEAARAEREQAAPSAPRERAAPFAAPDDPPAPPPEADAEEALESRLGALERRAAEAYGALEDAGLPGLRADELRALAQRFPGTPTAARAAREAEALAARAQALEARLDEAALALRAAAAWPPAQGDERALHERLEALRAWRPPDEIARHPGFDEARDALALEIAATALADARAARARADELAQEGRFHELAALLAALERRVRPPAFAPGEPVPLAKLRLELAAAAERAAALGPERALWLAGARSADRERLAAALGPESPFPAALRALDLDALDAALDDLRAGLRTDEARAFADALASDVRAARAALAALVAAFDDPGWRRRAIVDAQAGRGLATVRAASPDGLVLEEGGAPISWSRFAVHADWMRQLFHERLAAPWSPDTRREVAALLRLCACAEAAEAARAALAADAPADAALLEPFAACEAWRAAELPGADERLEREREAARLFVAATAAAGQGSWSLALEAARALVALVPGSLFAALLSDGSATDGADGAPR